MPIAAPVPVRSAGARSHIALAGLAAAVLVGSALAGPGDSVAPANYPAAPAALFHINHWSSTSPLPLPTAKATKPVQRQRAARDALDQWLASAGLSHTGAGLVASDPGSGSAAGLPTVLHFQQQVEGVPVFGARVNVLLDPQDRPRALSGALSDIPERTVGPAFALTELDALRSALGALTGSPPSALQARKLAPIGTAVAYQLAVAGDFRAIAPVRISRWWYPGTEGLEPAYRVELAGARPGNPGPLAQALLVSGRDGAILRSEELVHDLRPLQRPAPCPAPCAGTAFSYRVLADRRGWPLHDPFGHTSPHPTGLRDGSQPQTTAATRLLPRRHAGLASGDPWLPDGATETVGNNVDAFFQGLGSENGRYVQDVFDSWGPLFDAGRGDFRAPVSSPQRFDYSYDVAAAPGDYFQRPGEPVQPVPLASPQLRAKIVQGFYLANWLHDLFHDLGFDEAAGNMQMDNFGRGGIAGDPLMVHAGWNTTFAFVPGDGISPSLTMGLNAFSLSNRDMSLDFGVFVHEWTHTMFSRLTDMVYRGQPGAVNEGTADFVGVFLMLDASHRDAPPATGPFHGAHPIGAYANMDYDFPFDDLPPAGSPQRPDDTWYHGIRRFPYSASLAINPLTFRHISPENPLPAGFEPFDWKLRSLTAWEIHTAGEIWGLALWQCSTNILAATTARGFENAQRAFLADLVAALKLFPLDATYTEARDAVLMAVRARSEDDYRRCRAGFATRGLGAGAVSPPRDSVELRGVVESFVDAEFLD